MIVFFKKMATKFGIVGFLLMYIYVRLLLTYFVLTRVVTFLLYV